MKKSLVILAITFVSTLAHADVYFCNFYHSRHKFGEPKWKASDLVFKNHSSTLKDPSGDVKVRMSYSWSRNIVTKIVSNERFHINFEDVKTAAPLLQNSVELGEDIQVASPNNWTITCSSVLMLP